MADKQYIVLIYIFPENGEYRNAYYGKIVLSPDTPYPERQRNDLLTMKQVSKANVKLNFPRNSKMHDDRYRYYYNCFLYITAPVIPDRDFSYRAAS